MCTLITHIELPAGVRKKQSVVLMCGSSMLLMRGQPTVRYETHGSCNSFMHDRRVTMGRWPAGRWAMEGTLTKWSYYSWGSSFRGNYPTHCSSVSSPQKSHKDIPLPVTVCVCVPTSQSWACLGKEILWDNKKPNCLRRWTATINDLVNFPLLSTDLGPSMYLLHLGRCDAGGTTHP